MNVRHGGGEDMTQVDFYQLGRDPAAKVVPQLASKVLQAGGRLLVVTRDEGQLADISRGLWADQPLDFLAHGKGGEKHAERQPILLAQDCTAANGARFVLFADGIWREEGLGFERAFLMFDEATLQGARACWRSLDGREKVTRKFWKHEDGHWREGP